MNNPSFPGSGKMMRKMGGGPGGGGSGGGGPMHSRMMAEKPKNAKKTFIRLIKYIGASKYLLLILLGVMLFSTLLGLAGPALQAMAIDSITLKKSGASVDFGRLTAILAVILGLYLATSALSYFEGIFSARLSQNTVRDMRNDLFNQITKLPIKYIDNHSHGDIMSRLTNDAENVSNTISQSIGSLFSGIITVIGTLIIMLLYNPLLTVISLVTIPLSMYTTAFMAKHMRKYFLKQQQLLGELNGHAEEMVTGYTTVVAFGKEKKAIEEFKTLSTNLKKVGIKAQILGGLMGPVMNIIGNMNYLLIAGVGGYLAVNNIITIGIIQAFLIYSKQFTRPINEIANQYAQIQTAIAGAERIFEIMDNGSETDNGTVNIAGDSVHGALEFNNVFFSYTGKEQVLKDFNLSVESGRKIAIVGATGAGKTTVVNLLTRFYDIDKGEILLDNVNINDITKKSLRDSISIVLQDTVLFSDTIENNIRYGRENASNEDIIKAAQTANAHVFIDRLPDGYNTVISESGNNLSIGQRQLLAIARAVLANPKILILDEATSSIDTRTEMQIQEAMLKLMKNRTSLIIAHRLSTIRDADKIVVVDDGRITESGSHEELISKRGCYFKLYQKQFVGIET